MTAIMEDIAFAADFLATATVTEAPKVTHVTSLDEARRMACRMLECARPNHESMLGYALACSEWYRYGFHECTGPLFDEVNALREVWWGEGLGSPRGAVSLKSLAAVLRATSPT